MKLKPLKRFNLLNSLVFRTWFMIRMMSLPRFIGRNLLRLNLS